MVAVGVLAIGALLWVVLGDDGPAGPGTGMEKSVLPETSPPETAVDPAATSPVPAPIGVPAPKVRIGAGGRLVTSAEALRDGEVLALGLSMPDVSRGSSPREVKIVGVDGRLLDLQAQPIEGAGKGVRIDVDPEWLQPGRYMIQVETADPGPLALRRYVLEISDPAGEAVAQ